MSSPFSITAASNTVFLDLQRRGEATFTVRNEGGRALRGRARLALVRTEPPAPADPTAWLSITGNAERDFAIAGVEQVKVQVAAPLTAPAGSYTFRVDMVGVANPDEDFTQGPSVTFQVAEQPKPQPKKFPWWIIAVVVGVLAIVAVGIVLWRSSENAKSVRATATAQAIMTRTAIEATQTAVAIAFQTATAVTATAQAAATQTAIANATATARAAATQTAIAQATATAAAQATQTAAANATATALAAAIDKYTGNWVGQSSNPPYITKLQINRDGRNAKITVTGSAKMIVASGGLASVGCSALGSGTSECTWGEGTAAFAGDPLSFSVPQASGLSHQLTASLTPDRKTLTIVDQVFLNGRSQGVTSSYLFERSSRPWLIIDVIKDQPLLLSPGILRSVLLTPSP